MAEMAAKSKSKPPQIGRKAKSHLYIDEWFEHRGLNDEKVAGRLGVDRTTVWKWRKYPNRLDPGKLAQLAIALDCDPADFWRPPARISLDAIAKDAPDADLADLAEVVSRLVARR